MEKEQFVQSNVLTILGGQDYCNIKVPLVTDEAKAEENATKAEEQNTISVPQSKYEFPLLNLISKSRTTEFVADY